MVWCAVLYEHASKLSVAAFRWCGVLSQIGGTSTYITDRYIPRVSALYRFAVAGSERAADMAVNRDFVSLDLSSIRVIELVNRPVRFWQS